MSISDSFEKLIKFGELVGFTIEGSTINVCSEREIDTVIKLVNDGKEIDLICRNDGNFDNYSFQTIEGTA